MIYRSDARHLGHSSRYGRPCGRSRL